MKTQIRKTIQDGGIKAIKILCQQNKIKSNNTRPLEIIYALNTLHFTLKNIN